MTRQPSCRKFTRRERSDVGVSRHRSCTNWPLLYHSVDIEHLNEQGTIAAVYEGIMAIPLMVIGQVMLYQRLGPASFVVLFVLIGFGLPSSWLSFAIKDRQK